MEAKAAWYQSLTLAERMDLFCEFTDLALELNPRLPDAKDAQQTQGRVRVLSADLIASKRGAGRKTDLEDVRLLELPKKDE